MNYVLINREGVVVDVLHGNIRYIKLLSGSGIVIACPESEGTGVIGSDADTHYVLMKSDTTNNPNAVRVIEVSETEIDEEGNVREVPFEVIAGKTKFNSETGEFEQRYTLEDVQAMKQQENKVAFAKYLAEHPMTWVDGKEYGITQEDQSEISLNLSQYQIAVTAGVGTPILEWHARHEECTPWTVEQLTALSLAITQAVYPIYHKMQEFKTQIYGASTIEEVEAIDLVFENEVEE